MQCSLPWTVEKKLKSVDRDCIMIHYTFTFACAMTLHTLASYGACGNVIIFHYVVWRREKKGDWKS